ncbi:MAG: NTP transferase domain-containing protein [Bacteroidetes bacterium]|nr:NTP transferase domain-containing protein [Bacteroidota bacterium]
MAVKGMILAAGYGTRLAALTRYCPKALLPVSGIPMIHFAVEKLKRAGCRELIVNAHHFADQIIEYFQQTDAGVPVHVLREPDILGTGGAVLHAAPLLKDEDVFLLYNADIVTDADLQALLLPHTGSAGSRKLLATLLVNRRETRRALLFDSRMQFLGKEVWLNDAQSLAGDVRRLGFCGVHAISGELFRLGLTEGFSDIFDLYRYGMDRGCTLHGVLSEAYWTDLGTPDRIAAHESYMRQHNRTV